MTDRLPILGLSDALPHPTGFAKVARQLFTQLPQDRFRLGYLSRGWVGSQKFPGIATYATGLRDTDIMCQDSLPSAIKDFAGKESFVLWTLMDFWQTDWLSRHQESPQTRPIAKAWLKQNRSRFRWIAHFPIDGEGPVSGLPPLRFAQNIGGADVLVAMSEWGRRMAEKAVGREVQYISHAVDTDVLKPGSREEARDTIERTFAQGLARGLASLGDDAPKSAEAFMREVQDRAFKLRDHFTIVCVMANRTRKLWWDTLRAFRILLNDVPDARMIALCADRIGKSPGDSWPLEDCCRMLGLRLEQEGDNPNVTLLETYVAKPGSPEDESLAMLIQAADCAVLLSQGEGFGIPQLEAHACGIPCVVGKYSASVELAVDDREFIMPRSFYWTPGNMVKRPIYDPVDLADRLRYAARNPSWRKEVGAKGVEQAKERSWQKVLPQWIDLLATSGASTPALSR